MFKQYVIRTRMKSITALSLTPRNLYSRRKEVCEYPQDKNVGWTGIYAVEKESIPTPSAIQLYKPYSV
jgi:hypothetical protein